jgi:hypothetical protein
MESLCGVRMSWQRLNPTSAAQIIGENQDQIGRALGRSGGGRAAPTGKRDK